MGDRDRPALANLEQALRDVRIAASALANAADIAIAASEQGYRVRDIQAVASPHSNLLCSGCGIHQRSTLTMIALRDGAYICAACVGVAAEMVEEKRAEQAASEPEGDAHG